MTRMMLIVALMVAGTAPAYAQDTWANLGDAGARPYNSFVTGYGGRFYWFGGYAATTHATRVYDPTTSAWTSLGVPSSLRGPVIPASATVGSRVYTFGGLSGSWPDATSDVHYFDIPSNTWGDLAPMPTARLRAAAVAVGNLVYVIGGSLSDVGPSVATVDIYDTVADTWSPGTDLPLSLDGPWCGEVGGRIEVAGGWNDDVGDYVTNGFEFDTTAASPAWVDQDPIPLAGLNDRGRAGGRLYCSGGGVLLEFDRTRPAGERWIQRATAPATIPAYPVEDGVLLSGRLYFLGDIGPDDNYVLCAYTPVDVSPPSGIEPISPVGGVDLVVNTASGIVRFIWTGGSDDLGVTGYDIEVASDPAFAIPLHEGTFAVTQADFTVMASANTLFWRVRGFDFAGNQSPWSTIASFDVVSAAVAGTNPTASDESAKPRCGQGATTEFSAWPLLLLIIVAAGRRCLLRT